MSVTPNIYWSGLQMETMIRYLCDFGLSDKEAKVYINLSKLGPRKVSEIARSLQFSRLQAYRALQKLSDKGLIEVSLERPRRYIAIPIERALDLLTQEAKSRVYEMEEKKPLILKEWAKTPIKHMEEPSTRFRIIQGRKNIYKFRHRLFESAGKEICAMTTRNGLLRSVTYGTDNILEECTRRGIIVRRISEIDGRNVEAAKRFLEFCELRHMSAKNIARLTIVDDKEVLIYSTVDDSVRLRADKDVCLWTDNHGFVKMMKRFYDAIWNAAVNGHSRIKEIETGKPIETFQPIKDPREVDARIRELLSSVEQDLLSLTTEKGIYRLLKAYDLEKIADRGVRIRIIAPITRRSLKAARQLAGFCEIRHVESGTLEVLITDRKKIIGTVIEPSKDVSLTTGHKYAFYSNSENYATSVRAILEKIWNDAPTLEDKNEVKTGRQIPTSYGLVLASLATFLLKGMKETVEEELLRKLMNKAAKRSVDHLFEELGWKELLPNFDYALKRIAHVYELGGAKTNVASLGDDTFNFDVQNCPMQAFLPNCPEICEMERLFLQMLLSRYGSVEIEMPSSLSKGDKYCRHIIQLKKVT